MTDRTSNPNIPGEAFVAKFRREPTSASDAAWMNGYFAAMEKTPGCAPASADASGAVPLSPRHDRESAPETNGIDPDYKLPCEVRLAPGMTLGKGVPLRTLLTALRHREQWSDPGDLVFQDERAMAMRRALTALHQPQSGTTISNEHEHCTIVESSEKSEASREPLPIRKDAQ